MEQSDHSEVLGRDPELAVIQRFIEAVPDGPRGLVLEGSAGIGKTTLWQAAVAAGAHAGFRVLVTRAVESEATLSYMALVDLFDHVADDVQGSLPQPQQRAMDAALLRSDASIPDRRAMSLASLGLIRTLAGRQPVCIAIDDVQWLDPSSARVLFFVLRRLVDEPVGVVASRRLGSGVPSPRVDVAEALGHGRARELPVGPLTEEAIGRLLRERTEVELSRTVVLRVHAVTQGNPLFALEVGRAIAQSGWPADSGETLPVPEDLRRLLVTRIGRLPASSREALLEIACLTHATEELVLSAAADPAKARWGLAEAEAAKVIVRREGGRLWFTHPLFGSAVTSSASAGELRDVHARLAGQVADAEERARHLALAMLGPDRALAEELDLAARHARARGAPDAAAELSELAMDRTPGEDTEGLRRRRLDAAAYHFDAGDASLAAALLRRTAEELPAGTGRAEVLYRLSSMSWMDLERGVRAPLIQALPQAQGDPGLLAGIHTDLAWVDIYRGDVEAARAHGEAAEAFAAADGGNAIRADALATLSMARYLRGADVASAMSDAIALQDAAMKETSWTDASVYTTPRAMLGLQQMWAGDLEQARATLELELAEYERLGMYTLRQEVLCYLAELECRAGRWAIGGAHAAEAAEAIAESGLTASWNHVVRFNQALAASYLGQVDEARGLATEGLELARANDDAFNGAWNGAVLGFLELSVGRFEDAARHLEPVAAYLDRLDAAEPGVIPCVPDQVEALVSLGRVDDARAVLERFMDKARAKDRPWGLAAAHRCMATVSAADGDVDTARAALDKAMKQHARTSQPFETARTLMTRGIVERRARQKRSARKALEEAVHIFDDLGAPLWAARAREELVRVGGDGRSPSFLTPTEERVIELVAEGRTNREVADALFISVKTVEANLTRIFHKLDVRSRADLIRLQAGTARSSAHPRYT